MTDSTTKDTDRSYKVFHNQMNSLKREHKKAMASLEKEVAYLNEILRRTQILAADFMDGKL